MSEARQEAITIARELTEIRRQPDGEVAYHASIRERLAAADPDDHNVVVLGAFAAEIETLPSAGRVPAPDVASDLLRPTVTEAEGEAFTETMATVAEAFRPSVEFCQALGPNAWLAERVNLSWILNSESSLEPDSPFMGSHASGRGVGTFILDGVPFMPIAGTILRHKAGVTNKDALTQLTRTSSQRLVTQLMESRPHFMQVTKRFDDLKGKYGDRQLENGLWVANTYNELEQLARDFGDLLVVGHRDRTGEPFVRWAEEKRPVEVGCPVTLLRKNLFKLAWKEVAKIHDQGGYFEALAATPSKTGAAVLA